MARVGVIVVSYRADPQPLFDSIKQSRHVVRWYIFVHGENPDLRAKLDIFSKSVDARYFPYGVNRGLARSWNDGIIASSDDENDVTVILNDDLFFYEGGFDAFIDFVMLEKQHTPEFGIISVCGKEAGGTGSVGSGVNHNKSRPQDFACAAIGRGAIEKIGFFDENFWPAYIEDDDYFHRLGLARLPILYDERVLLEHNRSAAARKDRVIGLVNRERVSRNREYYARKWGGPVFEERFKHPFNDPAFNLFIAKKTRAAPFAPKYDRTDLDVAQSEGLLQENFTEELLSLLHRHAGAPRRYMEWSNGEGTAVVAEYLRSMGVEFFLSIDDDTEHLRRAAAELPKYSFLHFRLIQAAADASEAEASADYIFYPLRLDQKFDVVLIAGKWPMDCALLAPRVLTEDGLVILDEGERLRHRAVHCLVADMSGAGARDYLDNLDNARDAALREVYDIVEKTPRFIALRLKGRKGTVSPQRPARC